jgi:hypothetical protein
MFHTPPGLALRVLGAGVEEAAFTWVAGLKWQVWAGIEGPLVDAPGKVDLEDLYAIRQGDFRHPYIGHTAHVQRVRPGQHRVTS